MTALAPFLAIHYISRLPHKSYRWLSMTEQLNNHIVVVVIVAVAVGWPMHVVSTFSLRFLSTNSKNADTMQASFALVHRKRWGLSSRVWIIRSPTKTHSELWMSYLSRDDLLCQYYRGQSLLHNHRFFIIVVRRNGICVCYCLCVFGWVYVRVRVRVYVCGEWDKPTTIFDSNHFIIRQL